MGLTLSIIVCIVLIYFYYLSVQNQKIIQVNQTRKIEYQKKEKNKEKIISSVISDLDKFKPDLLGISKKIILNNDELLKLISSNENDIKIKGGDEQILKLMMVNQFLNVFRDKIIDFQLTYGTDKEIEDIKSEILNSLEWNKKEYGNVDGRYGVRWRYDGFLYTLTINNSEYDNPDKIGHKKFLSSYKKNHQIILENFDSMINNYEYLKSLGVSMILFYLSDKMIKYFELYQIFEQLGTFDKTWEKKVFKKMEDIEDTLGLISESLKNIEYNTSKILDNTEGIVNELKGVNSQLDTTNLLLTINTYQTWRTNRKIK